jgi:hypothetical protein
VLKPGGVLIQIVQGTPVAAEKAAAAKVKTIPVRVHPDGGQLRRLAK